MSENKVLDGPARANIDQPEPGTEKFNIHNLKDGRPVCGWKTNLNFMKMSVKLEKIKPWKLCQKCFPSAKEALNHEKKIVT